MEKKNDYIAPNGGIVKVIKGNYKGRIGYYDDDVSERVGLVYFGSPSSCSERAKIRHSSFIEATTDSFLKRRDELSFLVRRNNNIKLEMKVSLLEEMNYIDNVIAENYFSAIDQKSLDGTIFFISHSSKDKTFAKILATDLVRKGYSIWLDEWSIKVGESIPRKISEGLKYCNYVIIILSKESVKSKWVENEWHVKYWDEVSENQVKVLPILIEDCEIPNLLKTKKYADFRDNYNTGFSTLFNSVKSD